MAKDGNIIDTHSEGAPIMGLDGTVGSGAVHFVNVDSSGRVLLSPSTLIQVEGTNGPGNPGSGNPVYVQGYDAQNASTTMNPVLVGGWTGSKTLAHTMASGGQLNVALWDGNGNKLLPTGNNADNVAAGASAGLPIVNYNYVFDGTNWDRMRACGAANGFPGVGIQTSSGSAFGTQTPADGMALANLPLNTTALNMVFNGSSYDRMRGDSTNGIRVDARRGQTLAFAAIDCAASGDNTIVSANATRKLKVYAYVLVVDSAVSVKWKSGAGTNLSGAMSLAANGTLTISGSPSGWLFETAVNNALVLNLSAAVQVSGHVAYFGET